MKLAKLGKQIKSAAVCCMTACMVSHAFAGVFNVSPLRVALAPKHITQPLSLTNEGDEPLVVQVQPMQWTQENGEEVCKPTNDVLASPPIITIPPHGAQIVRVGLRRSFDPNRELSYRLFLTEMPSAATAESIGIQMRLRISLPVFVVSNTAAKPALAWSLIRTQEGGALLRVKNDGDAHAQVAHIQLSEGDQLISKLNDAVYLLPGSKREWPLTIELGKTIGSDPVRLQAYMDGGDVNSLLTPQAY
jgi:fimbrial chaperone protein